MITYADEAAPAADTPEARRADGSWPVCRPDMREDGAIIARMAEDALALMERQDALAETDLVRLAWPLATVRRLADDVRETMVRLAAARSRRFVLERAA